MCKHNNCVMSALLYRQLKHGNGLLNAGCKPTWVGIYIRAVPGAISLLIRIALRIGDLLRGIWASALGSSQPHLKRLTRPQPGRDSESASMFMLLQTYFSCRNINIQWL